MPTRTLYLCYFGLREPLVETQVLPYLRQLATGGMDVSLLTFEPQHKGKWTPHELNEERRRLAGDGIRWFHLTYHKRPSALATAYDVLAGAGYAIRLVHRYGINVLHARAHVPMAMAMLAERLVGGCRLVFDIRGLMAEEYADAGVWQDDSTVFRAVKKLERAGIRRADQIVVLTRRMRDWLVEEKLASAEKIEVIPCCVDFTRYEDQQHDAAEVGAAERFEVVYAGSVTGLYLLEEMGQFFLELRARRPDSFLRVLTMSPPDEATATLRRAGLGADDFWVGGVRPAEVPGYLRRARLGLSFRQPTFSQIAASPTKIPEYLAAGLPVVSNRGIGDVDDLLEREEVGVVVGAFTGEARREAAERALRLADSWDVPARCRRIARQYFDLASVGGARYRSLYDRIEARTFTVGAESHAE